MHRKNLHLPLSYFPKHGQEVFVRAPLSFSKVSLNLGGKHRMDYVNLSIVQNAKDQYSEFQPLQQAALHRRAHALLR